MSIDPPRVSNSQWPCPLSKQHIFVAFASTPLTCFLFAFVLAAMRASSIDDCQDESRTMCVSHKAATQAGASGPFLSRSHFCFFPLQACENESHLVQRASIYFPGQSRSPDYGLWPCLKLLTPQFCCVAGSTSSTSLPIWAHDKICTLECWCCLLLPEMLWVLFQVLPRQVPCFVLASQLVRFKIATSLNSPILYPEQLRGKDCHVVAATPSLYMVVNTKLESPIGSIL